MDNNLPNDSNEIIRAKGDDIELDSGISPSTEVNGIGIIDLPTNLDSLSFSSAKEYLINIISIKKGYEKSINEINIDIQNFEQKKSILLPGRELDLLKKAVLDKTTKLNRLKSEDMELSIKIELLTESLKSKEHDIKPLVDPEHTLASIESMAGKSVKDMEFEEKVKQLDAENRLKELKKRIKKD